MNLKKDVFRTPFFLAACLLIIGLVTADRAMCYDFTFWGRGALAHDSDLIRSEMDEKPFILYFHIRNSEWCEKMTNVYLASTEVEDFLRELIKVEINPDRDAYEEAIASKYKVSLFPTFLVFVPAFESEPHRINPFFKGKNMTVDEFIQAVKGRIIHVYHQQGFAYYEKKEYEKAIEYFKRTLDYDPKYVPAYHAIAVMQHTMGLAQKDLNLLMDAEGNLLKALEIDPDHELAKTELENVRKNINIIRSR